MTNFKYVEEVINSNMSGEAKALALSILVGREPSQRYSTIANARGCIKDSHGADYSKNILNSRLLAIALPMLQNTENGVRAKDIAKIYNETFNPCDDLTHHDTRHILLKLLDCEIVKYENREEKIEIVDSRGLRREIFTNTRYYFLNI